MFTLLHIRSEPSRAQMYLEARIGVDSEHAIARRGLEQLHRPVDGEFIRGKVLGYRHGLTVISLAALEIGAELAHSCNDGNPIGIDTQRNRVDGPGVDLPELGVDQLLETHTTGTGGALGHLAVGADVALNTEVEPAQPGLHVFGALGDVVEIVLHPGGEGVVDQLREVLLHERHHRERGEGRNQGHPLLPDVPAIGDGRDDRRVGGRPTDTEFLELLGERGLAVAGRGLRVVRDGFEGLDRHRVALGHVRQNLVGTVVLTLLDALGVRSQETLEQDGATGRRKDRFASVGQRTGELHRHGLSTGVGHLRGDGALPDHLVDTSLGGIHPGTHLVDRTEGVARRPDRLVSFLGVANLLGVGAWTGGQVVLAPAPFDLGASCLERGVRQRRAVGSHVGDVAVLIETLRSTHGLGRGQPELATGLLLQGRGHERRLRSAGVGLGLHRAHLEYGLGEPFAHSGRGALVEQAHARLQSRLLQLAVLAEVLAGGDLRTIQFDQVRGEGPLIPFRSGVAQLRLHVPPGGRGEGHPFTFAFDDHPGGHRLHPTRRQTPHHLLPEHRGDLVAVETVEDPAGLLRIDHATIELARVVHRLADRIGGDLVEDHAPHGHLRVEHLDQVPCDGLTLAILISCEIELVRFFQQALQATDVIALLG